MLRISVLAALALGLAGLAAPLHGQCDPGNGMGGVGPDVIVGTLDSPNSYGAAGGFHAYSIGTTSCNIGTQTLLWISNTTDHPVIAQNMYRMMNGRFEQIGMSWLKHGFTALQNNACGCGCIANPNGSALGVGCSDPYSAALNGSQGSLGARSEVIDPADGTFLYPQILDPANPDLTWRRLRVSSVDVDPAQNAGALYFVEGQYVSPDDAAAGNAHNNASHRRVLVANDANRTITYSGSTVRQLPAIYAWQANDPSVTLVDIFDGDGGRLILGTKVTDVGSGLYSYEYALFNLNSTRAVRSFQLPLPAGVNLSSIGFHDAQYHSGEPYSGTDWPATQSAGMIEWATQTFAVNQNANALRWSTLYNFRFIANAPPIAADVTLGFFLTGSPSSITAPTLAPAGDFTLPVTGLSCTVAVPEVDLAWTNAEAYDSIQVLRDGVLLATLGGGATSYTDTAPLSGSHNYGVNAIAGGISSGPAPCSVSYPFPFTISLPGGPLDLVEPAGGDLMSVQIVVNPGFALAAGSATLWVNSGILYTPHALSSGGGNFWNATFPAIPCGTSFTYYVSATSTGGTTVAFPEAGAGGPLGAVSAFGFVDDLDEMESVGGWLVGPPNTATTGNWAFGNPSPTAEQSGDDHTPGAGVNCWVTGLASGTMVGDFDVDNGSTTLYSPIYDMTGMTDPTISYWRWFSNDGGSNPGQDIFTVQASANGTTWVTVETVGPTGPQAGGGWFEHTFRVLDFVTLSASVQVRFTASDLNLGSIVEAAVDDFAVHDLDCFVADCNSNGIDDAIDISTGTSEDCNFNALPDECDIASGTSQDCNANAIPDLCDIALGASDCDADGVPDSCQLAGGGDCDADGLLDSCEIAGGAPDCDGNGALDSCDIAGGAADANSDGIPDVCQLPHFVRGDANASGGHDISDAVVMLNSVFTGAPVVCLLALDANSDGSIDISDPVRLLGYLFAGELPLAVPFPGCGTEAVPNAISCGSFPICP